MPSESCSTQAHLLKLCLLLLHRQYLCPCKWEGKLHFDRSIKHKISVKCLKIFIIVYCNQLVIFYFFLLAFSFLLLLLSSLSFPIITSTPQEFKKNVSITLPTKSVPSHLSQCFYLVRAASVSMSYYLQFAVTGKRRKKTTCTGSSE